MIKTPAAAKGKKTRARQDDMARRRRMLRGCCPTHGIGLVQTGVDVDDKTEETLPVVECPRQDCDFKAVPKPGTTLWKGLFR